MKQKQSASKNQKQKETRAHTITVLRGVRLPSQHTCSSVPSLIFRRSFPQLIQQSFGRRKTARSASHFWLAGSRLAGPVCSGKQRGSHRGNGAAPGGSWPRGGNWPPLGQLCWCASGAVSLPCLASPSRSRAQVHARADLRAWAADAQESLEIEVPPIESGKRASVCRSLLDQFGPGKILPWTPNTCLSA